MSDIFFKRLSTLIFNTEKERGTNLINDIVTVKEKIKDIDTKKRIMYENLNQFNESRDFPLVYLEQIRNGQEYIRKGLEKAFLLMQQCVRNGFNEIEKQNNWKSDIKFNEHTFMEFDNVMEYLRRFEDLMELLPKKFADMSNNEDQLLNQLNLECKEISRNENVIETLFYNIKFQIILVIKNIMDFKEYRKRGKEMVDYIADYLENIRDRRVFPDVKPGYMRHLLPDCAPIEGEHWEDIFADIEKVIMPGITHWQSPHMHAYFPGLNSFPSLLGDMLADAINCLGFTWASSPACTELEVIVMNWLGKMIGLPDHFLHLTSYSKGGGVIQTTASEATLVCLLAGRTKAIQRFHEKHIGYQDAEINAKLVAYCSDQAHSSVEKAALIGLVRMRYIEADDNLSMRGKPLREAIEDDIKQGLVPFWVCATLGTTGSCSFDNLEEIGSVCSEFNLWLHVDAAYAGSAFICPEFRFWLKGIDYANSIAFNPSKWLMVHFDATALWLKDSTALHRTFNVEPLYLQHENSGVAIDYMHWQIPLSRRFRALKMWFVIRSFGIKGLQKHIREGVRLAQKFEALVSADHRFEIPAKRFLGLVVFRIKGDNEITERLLKRLNHRGNIHCIPSSLKGKYVIRFTITSTHTTVDDILRDWSEIRLVATTILEEMNITISAHNRVFLKDTKEKNEAFGSSLLLSNSPMSPKVVNGSFAAIFDDEFLAKTYAGIRIAHQESPSMRRRVRGIMMSGKQFSLDSHMDVVVQKTIDSTAEQTPKEIETCGRTLSYRKTKNPNAICEDNEEGVEDCEAYVSNSFISRLPKISQYQSQKQITNDETINLFKTSPDISSSYFTFTPVTKIFPDELFLQVTNEENSNHLQESMSIEKVYPGKRFLDLDLEHIVESCSFTNTIFRLPTPTETWLNSFSLSLASTSMEEQHSPCKVDWAAVMRNFSEVPPKRFTKKISKKVEFAKSHSASSSSSTEGGTIESKIICTSTQILNLQEFLLNEQSNCAKHKITPKIETIAVSTDSATFEESIEKDDYDGEPKKDLLKRNTHHSTSTSFSSTSSSESFR